MKIFRTGSYENFYDMPLSINWSMTKRCNYRCSYCFHYGAKNNGGVDIPQRPFSTLEQIKNAVNNIVSLNRPYYEVGFVGGEPTIHPHLFDAISMLHENLQERLFHVGIITNGSRNEELYKKIADIAKHLSITMTISIHTDHVEMNHILELIQHLSPYVNMRLSLMFNPDKREMVHSIYETLYDCRKKFPFIMRVLLLRYGDNIDSRYTAEDFDWHKKSNENFTNLLKEVQSKIPLPHADKKNPFQHIFHDVDDGGERKLIETDFQHRNFNLINGMLEFKGMYCISNSAVLRIEENGFCNGMVCDADEFLCNIFEEGSLLKNRDKLIHIVKCPKNICGCGTNDAIPKFASEREAKEFVAVMQARQNRLFSSATI